MQRFFQALLLVFLFTIGQQALARNDDYILSRAYLPDTTNALRFADVQGAAFTPYRDLLTGGFSKGAYWIRLDIRAHTQDLVLKIRPAYTNEVVLYDPASPGKSRVTGSAYPLDDADVEAVSLNFLLAPSSEDRAVYLRVKSVSSYLLYVEAVTLSAFKRTERTEHLVYAGYVMLTLILAIWLCVTWLTNRERVIGAFTVQQFMAVMHGFIKLGFARAFLDRYISDATIDVVSNMVVVTYPLMGLVANMLLLQEYGLKRPFRFVFNALIGCSLFIIWLFLSGNEVTALSANVMLVLVLMTYFLICALWGTERSLATEAANALQLKAIRLFYGFNLLIWLLVLLPLLGVVSTGALALYALFVYNVTSSLVFFFLLQYRARRLLRSQLARAATLSAEATQERQRREEQGMLMAMLSHEIKTPLSVLKLVMDEKVAGSDLEGHANRAVGNINFIVNRCLQLGKLDARAIQLDRVTFSAQEFVGVLLTDYPAAGRVQVDVPPGLMICADRETLRVVVSNLLENAMKYGAAESPIALEIANAYKDAIQGVQITVRNTVGPLGVPDADQVFKKYYRNTQATKIAGSGLGLFLVHELVGVMGGEVTYTIDKQQVMFRIWIPA